MGARTIDVDSPETATVKQTLRLHRDPIGFDASRVFTAACSPARPRSGAFGGRDHGSDRGVVPARPSGARVVPTEEVPAERELRHRQRRLERGVAVHDDDY